MTQFAVIEPGLGYEPQEAIELIRCPKNGLIHGVSNTLFGVGASIYLIEFDQKNFDDAYLTAQREIADGVNPDRTLLFQCLNRIVNSSRGVALWYGGDYLNMPVAKDWGDFRQRLLEDLNNAPYESYLLWRSHNSNLRR